MNRSPFLTLFLGIGLLATGFLVGYGFQSRASQSARLQNQPTPTPASTPSPPLVKGLHSSPDGALLAWTGVWDRSARAGVWVFDVNRKRARLSPSPVGWQDYVSQWRADGRALLVEREKIPRAAADAKPGLYQALVDRATLASGEVKNVIPPLPSGEKLVSGTFAPDGALLLKTRREPKNLFLAQNGQVMLLDSAAQSYGQNRAVKQNGHTIIYAVRDVISSGAVALFRVENSRAVQLTPDLQDVAWSYVSPSAKYLVVAREDSENGNYVWTLYEIGTQKARELKSQAVTSDAISVYWSPDDKQILGAAGEKLWSISIPSLQVKQVGTRADWNADDATWIGTQNAVAIVAGGALWRVNVASGQAEKLWEFPAQFWD
ncbi:hypothetical protein IAD21_01627 [Abditibacteriota bacterium]|nr:hypothetical protein IAD21_01627 [Abditibacteriota bacterium]